MTTDALKVEELHVLNSGLRRQAVAMLSMSEYFANDPCPLYAHHLMERASMAASLAKELFNRMDRPA